MNKKLSLFLASLTLASLSWAFLAAAPADEQTDMTSKIVNPNFDDGKNGWTGDWGNGDLKATSVNPLITSNNSTFDVYQDISGLPNGRYLLKAQAFTRPMTHNNLKTAIANGETLNNQTYLYANDTKTLVKLITDETSTDSNCGDEIEDGKRIPNNSTQAANAFNAGMYENELEFVINNGSVRIGIRQESTNGTTYVGYDNFRLIYLGELTGITEEQKTEILASVPEGTMNAEVSKALSAALEAFKADATVETYNALGQAIADAKVSIQAYKAVKEALEKADKTQLSEAARAQYNAAVESIVKAYNDATMTGDGSAQVATIEEALDAARRLDIATSNDKTGLIKNPQFNEGTTGWEGDFGAGAKKGTADNYLITSYGAGFNVYQTIEGLESGIYKLQVQAFSRPLSNSDTWSAYNNGEAVENLTSIYANGEEKLVRLIVEDYLTESSSTGSWSTFEKDGANVYIPNDSKAFSVAFSAGLYENELYCIVKEDGKLTIGIKNESELGTTYAGFDNFRLSFCGSLDMTSKIANPKFDDGKNGWEGDFGTGAVKATSTNPLITAYGGTFDVYQDIKDLPNGTYKLQVQAFTRPMDHTDLKTAVSEGQTLNNESFIYANNSETLVKLITEEYGTTDAWGAEFETGKYIPNSSSDAAKAFNQGMYENELLCIVTDGKLRIGIRQEATSGKPYVGYDNFRLTYVSTATALPEEEQETLTAADVMAYLTNCNKVAAQAVDHTAFDEAYNTAAEALKAENLSVEELTKIKNEIANALASLLKNGQTESGQFDLTSLIANSTFNEDLEGWNTTKPFAWNSTGVAQLANAQNSASLSQVLENMPAGKYTLKVQGFYRQSGWKEGLYEFEHGNRIDKLNLFLNNSKKTVKSLFEDGRSSLASANISRTEDVGATISGDGFPHLMSKVQDVFKPGNYWNYIEVEVAEDGDITLGVNLEETDRTDNWAVVDNFRLYYGNLNPVVLSSKNYTVKDDTPADVKIVKTIKAETLTPFSAPCDIPGSLFKAVYEVGALNYIAGNSTATIYPVENVRAGVPCYVISTTEIDTLVVGQTVIRAAEADTRQLIWDGGLIAPNFKNCTWTNTDLTGTARTAGLFKKYIYVDLNNMEFNANLENHQVRRFLSAKYSQSSSSVISTYNQPSPARRDLAHSVGIPVPASKAEGAVVKFSTNEDMSEAKTLDVINAATVCYIPNLIPGNTYYYEVVQGTEVVSKGQFTTEGPLRMVYAPSVYNIRDFGGWKMQDGRTTKYGLIYRGGEVNGFHAPYQKDVETLKSLGIGAEIDLRYNDSYDQDRETGKSGFGFTKGDTYYFAGANDYTAANLSETATQARLKEEFRFLLGHIREGRGVYFHCVFGADRTGFFAVLLEGLLGFTLNDLYHDYEFTSFAAPAGNRNKSSIQERIAVIQALDGKTLRDKFEYYWLNKVGITAEEVEEFRNLMLNEVPVVDAIQDVIPGENSHEIQAIYTINGTKVSSNMDDNKSGIYLIQHKDGSTKKIIRK